MSEQRVQVRKIYCHVIYYSPPWN